MTNACHLVILASLAWGLLLPNGVAAGAYKQSPPLDSLLKTFLAEFIEVTPGKGRFPAEFSMGGPDGVKQFRCAKASG